MTATAGKNAANAGCSAALSTQPGTRIRVQESIPTNETIASTTFNGASVANTAGLVKVTAATGANIVTFENEPVGPPQTGYVEVCKDPGDDYVDDTTTPFQFTVTDKTNVAIPVSVLVNQCSGPIKVAAGNVAIAETADRDDVREQHLRRTRPERARADQPDERHHHRRRPGQLRQLR